MTKRNPKQEGTCLYDCKPQVGPCPIGCNQCFHNRPGAFYVSIDEPHIPEPWEVGDGIVRMNCGHDSNIERNLVISTAQKYKRFFFNTSIPRYDFPGPVVLTANPKEEDIGQYAWPNWHSDGWRSPAANLMFVRLRTSATNLDLVYKAVAAWTNAQVPCVLTFMSYFTTEPTVPEKVAADVNEPCYEWRIRHINSYWVPTRDFIRYVMARYRGERLVSMCGGFDSPYCRDCLNCQTYFIQAIKRSRSE